MDDIDEQEQFADEREKSKLIARASAASTKGGLIQFRVEDDLVVKLHALAAERHTSPSILARQWVLERLDSEIARNQEGAKAWHASRTEILMKEARNPDSEHFQNGPFFIMHVLPLSKGSMIRPGDAEKIAMALRPLRRTRNYIGTINHLGYESRTAPDVPAKAFIQIYRTGEIESLRPIWAFDGIIRGTETDEEIVDAAFTACSTLAGLRIALPYLILTKVIGIRGLCLSSGYTPIKIDELSLLPVEITSWSQISANNSIEPMAQSLHESLNVFWNAGSIESSRTFDGNTWVPARRLGF